MFMIMRMVLSDWFHPDLTDAIAAKIVAERSGQGKEMRAEMGNEILR
jgi:hypothetical protein